MAEQYANDVITTLASSITGGSSSLSLTSAAGFPSVGDFRLKIDSEIIIVGARSGVSCSSLTRGAEGTTAAAHAAGARVAIVLTAAQVSGLTAGPASATDNAVARFDGTTGKVLQNTSVLTLGDDGAFGFPDGVRQTFNPDGTNAGLNVGSVSGDPSAPSNGDLWYDSAANELTARINGANVALGAGGGANIAIASVSLSHSDILAMFGTPITVVAAQGAGTVIVPVFAVLTYNTSAGAYTGGGAIGLYFNGANPAVMTFPATGLTGAATTLAVGTLVANALPTQANGINQALRVSNAGFVFATGNAANTAELVLGYYVATP